MLLSSSFKISSGKAFAQGIDTDRCAYCLHPTLNIAAVALYETVAEYDLSSGCKLGSTESADPLLAIQYTYDAATLIGLTQGTLLAWEPQFWKRKVLLQSSGKLIVGDALLAVGQGSRPVIFFASAGSKELYAFMTGVPSDAKAKDKQVVSDSVKRGLVALAAHPLDASVVFQLHEDSSMSASSLDVAQRALLPLWQFNLRETPSPITSAVFSVSGRQHGVSSDAIITLGTSDGFCGAYTSQPGAVPELLHQYDAGADFRIIGAGCAAGKLLYFPLDHDGNVVPRCWDAHTGVEIDLAGDSPLRSAAKGEKAQDWQSLWSPASAPQVQQSGTTGVQVHQSRGVAVLARTVAGATEMTLLKLDQVGEGHRVASTVVHTGLEYWAGQGDSVRQSLRVPDRVCYADSKAVKAYGLVTAHSVSLASFDGSKAFRVVGLIHSLKQGVVVAFLQPVDSPSGETKFTSFSVGDEASQPQTTAWTLPGRAGAFVGQEEQHYAILSEEGATLYQTSPSSARPSSRSSRSKEAKDGGPAVVKRISFAGLPAASIFSGPPLSNLPRSATEEQEGGGGSGVIMWSTSERVAISEVGSSSGYSRSGKYGLHPAHSLLLQPNERVLQTAWQDLIATASEGSILDDTGEGKASILGAVLTSQRLLLVSATLQVLASVSVGSAEAGVTSILWMGPALLFCTSENQVKQLCCDGSVSQVCSLGGGAHSYLVAALADRLLLMRRTSTGASTISSRYLSVLEPLLRGWASIAAMGILPGGLWRARSEMGKLARLYDSSRISPSLFGVLLAAGCADLALALARSQSSHQLTSFQKAATKAAAGSWADAVRGALEAHQSLMSYPRPPPQGSTLWKRLVGLGRTALYYGQMTAACELWKAAGHWKGLLPLYALAGDFNAIRYYCGPQAPPEAVAMGDQLLNVSGTQFARASAVGAQASSGDWKVLPELLSGSLAAATAEVALELFVSGTSSSPSMVLESAATELSKLEPSSLDVYVGLGDGSYGPLGKLGKSSKQDRLDPLAEMSADDGSFRQDSGSAAFMRGSDTSLPGLAAKDPFFTGLDSRPSKDSVAAGAESSPAQDPFSAATPDVRLPDLLPDLGSKQADAGPSKDPFDSSDSDNADLQPAAPPKRQFKIVIKDKSEDPAGTTDALKNAAVGLRLPPAFPPAFQPSFPSPSQPGPTALKGPLPENLFSAEPTASEPATPAASTPVPAKPPVPPKQAAAKDIPHTDAPQTSQSPEDLFAEGISEMEKGEWGGAAQQFGLALHAAKDAAQASQSSAYLTAVRLVEAQTSDPEKAPTLARFAATLTLQDKHKRALVQSAVQLNMKAGNYGYAAEQLMWLISQSVGQASPAFLNNLQNHLSQCEQRGGKDKSIPADEDLATFQEIISIQQTAADIDNCIRPIIAA